MQSLVYVSRSLLPSSDPSQALNDIQAVSIRRNTVLDITGMLIATPTFFAQFLEGSKQNLEEVMTLIRADVRHREMQVLWTRDETSRHFPQWRMARFHSAHFGPISLDPLLQDCHEGKSADAGARLARILDLISFNLSYLNTSILESPP